MQRHIETSRQLSVPHPLPQEAVGNIRFYSITFRLFKLPGLLEPACEDYGQVAVYKVWKPSSRSCDYTTTLPTTSSFYLLQAPVSAFRCVLQLYARTIFTSKFCSRVTFLPACPLTSISMRARRALSRAMRTCTSWTTGTTSRRGAAWLCAATPPLCWARAAPPGCPSTSKCAAPSGFPQALLRVLEGCYSFDRVQPYDTICPPIPSVPATRWQT